MFRILLILAPLFLVNSCIFLSRSALIDHDESEAISIFSLEVIYDGKPETRNSGITGFCQVRFQNEEFERVKFRSEKKSKFHFLKNEPGKMTLENMHCMHHVVPLLYLKNRHVDLSMWVFRAHSGFINYAGHITINYRSSGFKAVDLFGLGGVKRDEEGKVDVRVEDRIDDAVSFINQNYPELKNIPFNKSLLKDIVDLKHDEKPENYTIKPQAPTEAPRAHDPNIYFDPYRSPQAMAPYYNPYENQGPIKPLQQ